MTAGCQCGRRWTGHSQAHCSGDGSDSGPRAGCHRHFGSVRGFDRHRASGRCQDPATMATRSNRPVFRNDEGPLGVTWVQADDRPHPGRARRLAEADSQTSP